MLREVRISEQGTRCQPASSPSTSAAYGGGMRRGGGHASDASDDSCRPLRIGDMHPDARAVGYCVYCLCMRASKIM